MHGVRKDPALVIFGFDHVHAESGYQDVINLRGAVLDLQGDVVQEVKVWPRKGGLYGNPPSKPPG